MTSTRRGKLSLSPCVECVPVRVCACARACVCVHRPPPVICIKYGARCSQTQHRAEPLMERVCAFVCVWLLQADAADIDQCLFEVRQMERVCLWKVFMLHQ